MSARPFTLFSLVFGLGLLLGDAQAGEPFTPSWIKNDPATRSVTIELVANWNEHRRQDEVPLRGARLEIADFNGYYGGGMTVIVPNGWSVRVDLSNGSLW
jgi:hypothetical protein